MSKVNKSDLSIRPHIGGLASVHALPKVSPIQITRTDIVLPWFTRDKHPMAYTLDGVFTPEECRELIACTESAGYGAALVNVGGGRQKLMSDVRNNSRCMIDDPIFAEIMFQRIKDHLPTQWTDKYYNISKAPIACLNERLRFLKYTKGQKFEHHFDGTFERARPHKGQTKPELSFVTIQLYLNEGGGKDFKGGSTAFLNEYGEDHGKDIVDCIPRTGRVLVFEHRILHQGSEVTSGTKYCLRTDAMFQPDPQGVPRIGSNSSSSVGGSPPAAARPVGRKDIPTERPLTPPPQIDEDDDEEMKHDNGAAESDDDDTLFTGGHDDILAAVSIRQMITSIVRKAVDAHYDAQTAAGACTNCAFMPAYGVVFSDGVQDRFDVLHVLRFLTGRRHQQQHCPSAMKVLADDPFSTKHLERLLQLYISANEFLIHGPRVTRPERIPSRLIEQMTEDRQEKQLIKSTFALIKAAAETPTSK